MRNYKVAFSGVPASMQRISAGSPREAALEFFRSHRQGNTILVSTGVFSEQAFRPSDFAEDCPELATIALPLALPIVAPYDPSKDPFVIVCRASFIVASLACAGMAARYLLWEHNIPPGVVLSICAAMSLGCGVIPSSASLRRWMARDPQSLDAR